jgi:hypothetical protein
MFLALLATNCDTAESRPTTWRYIHAAIIAPSCATSSCHSQLSEVAGIDFSDRDGSYQLLLDRQYVVPGDLSSVLLLHLEGDEAELMPPDAPLPAGDRRLIEDWIIEGAVP